MQNFLKQYFSFNNRERKGIIVLLAIIVSLIISIQLVPYFVKQPHVDFNDVEKQIKKLQEVSALNSSSETALSSIEIETSNNVVLERKELLFNFNPNNASNNDLKKLGFSEKQIRTFSNYRIKGGRFFKKEDLKKIYGIQENFYLLLEPYIIFDTVKRIAPFQSESYLAKDITELNTADSVSLLKLQGIGPAFAHRIISYRKKLGGYSKMEQLMEVYGLDSVLFKTVTSQLEINSDLLTRININTASVEEFKRHPYFKFNIANAIVNYRNQHGAFATVKDIKKVHLFSDILYIKLVPYLTTE